MAHLLFFPYFTIPAINRPFEFCSIKTATSFADRALDVAVFNSADQLIRCKDGLFDLFQGIKGTLLGH